MTRPRRWSTYALTLGLLAAGLSAGGGSPPDANKSAEKWIYDRSLTVTPQGESVPALKYRLLPLTSELREGNAVPIYLRLVHEQSDASRKHWTETPQKWNELPLDRVPLGEAREFLKGVQTRFLQQIDLGARRRTAEWNYTLDQGSIIDILLPDAQVMRSYAPMLVLRARLAVAEGDDAAAAHAFETGFAFSRHVAEGPFLINGLVGIAIANQFADRLPEWIERPGSPNLYWPLTALPRPLIDIRKETDFEQRLLELQFPDLADPDRPRTPAEWDAVFRRVREEARRLLTLEEQQEGGRPDKPRKVPIPGTAVGDPASKSPDLPEARRYLTEQMGKPAAEVESMPPAQVLMLYLVGVYHEYRDEMFKGFSLPYPQARTVFAAAARRLESAPDTEAVRLAKLLLPAVNKVYHAPARLDRKVAALRTIEALRQYAAAHGGQLPDALGDVTEAPVPDDPGTGKPFEYRRDGATVTIVSRIPGEPQETTGLRYRVTVRAK